MTVYMMENEKLEKMLLEKEIEMKAMTWTVASSERTVKCLKTEKSPLMHRRKEVFSCLLQKITSSGQITAILLKYIPPVYIELIVNVGNVILKYFRREVSELVPFISKLRKSWKRKSDEEE